ncbi:MAG: excinuclease ABC subunit UvrB [candidate division Zixibacteria bacterium]|nr:excinuclease ABC subunit UvrB [candidate division Zixibacteria bacterium]MDH3937312.1 excinuclease ABC subunit UvrB [candidate division Zixibacteria bacterium]MDH4033094.1 excinuclease ABC subunit UvrB [candidate division Zixibacteria bacterium]
MGDKTDAAGAFQLQSTFAPKGDQPQAIAELIDGLKRDQKHQTLLGVTGSGKTFTIANVIAQWGRPALVLSHNKTLAAQLFGELKAFFPNNAVEFFISYYDYYQPEAYIPTTDTFIEKDTSVNEDIDRLRLRATASLLDREDVIIVASVSCIYGLGSPEEYKRQFMMLEVGREYDRDEVIRKLIEIHYNRNDIDFSRGNFRVRGDTIELIPAYHENAYRIEFFGDDIERISEIHPLTGEILADRKKLAVYPAKHFITSRPQLDVAIKLIEEELAVRLEQLRANNSLLEAQRLEMRTRYDLEMLRELGYCTGIENYSRHLTNRKEGERPFTLIDFLGDDFLTIIDESHQSIPQVRGMFHGDRSRKEVLVSHGFRLPSALDNRPLYFEEFENLVNHRIYVSATPADYELEKCEGVVVEQVIRPTGLLDPIVTVKPLATQVDDLLEQIKQRKATGERVLVTTLTKRMSEDLTDYLSKAGVRVRYLHSEVASIDRTEIIRDLRLKAFDVLIGVNLLREGLDLPEVSLVAILDADKEGFLRSARALIQTAGRAARNKNGEVIFYADKITNSMRKAIDETERRRKKQLGYNQEHNIQPETIFKTRDEILRATRFADSKTVEEETVEKPSNFAQMGTEDQLAFMMTAMKKAADNLDFETAVLLRDEITRIKEEMKKSAAKNEPRRLGP